MRSKTELQTTGIYSPVHGGAPLIVEQLLTLNGGSDLILIFPDSDQKNYFLMDDPRILQELIDALTKAKKHMESK